MENLEYKVIPHKEQRYETCGDYWVDEKGVQQVRVSKMPNPDFEFLVLMHELTELYLCQKRGIKEEDITNFDVEFEHIRTVHPDVIGEQEPGHMVSAPYHKEHCFAEKIEKLLAEELGVAWLEYDKTVTSL